VPDGLNMTLERALELSPDLRNLPQRGPQYARLLQSARTLEGLTRHASIHAAGVLITPGPLTDYVPLFRQNRGEVTTQWDMKSVEKAGLLKMDFLGLRTLSVLAEAVRLVGLHRGVPLDVRSLPLDDEATYRVFQEAETVAIFQFESSGMRDYLRKLKPTVFEDLVAMNALYRPGPMENIPYFIDCKHGRTVARYEHPDLEPILRRTYGVFVYQEQVMEAAHVLAGFSLAEADELRRAMGKKRPEEMEAKRKSFVEGCKHRKIPSAKAERIFQTMEKFAGYGFNASHASAYALIAYQSAYLKAHYPAEFMTATLTSEMSDSDRIVTLVDECRRMGLAVLPPDVNRSEWKFSLEEGAIRWGLGAVRNVGQGAAESLVAAREAGGPFRDLFEMASRLDARAANRRVVESLIAAGACDALGPERNRLTAAVPLYLERAASLHREREAGQASLFGEESPVALAAPALPEVPAWTRREKAVHEREVLGFYFSEHPLEHHREEIARLGASSVAEAVALGDGADARVVGLVSEVKAVQDRKGRRMAFVTLEDLSDRIECLVFADLFEQAGARLTADAVVCVGGRVSTREESAPKLVLSEILTLDEALEAYRRVLHLELKGEKLLEEHHKNLLDDYLARLDALLSRFPGDCEVYIHFLRPDHSTYAIRARRLRVAEDEAVLATLRESLPGVRASWGRRP
jgi:DNA polymerase-3 subunit alpha